MKRFIVIPTYNERKNISELVPLVFSCMPEIHILVVDDNSPDGTASQVKSMKKQFPRLNILERPGKQGLGKAYMHAFRNLLDDKSIEVLTTMDADFSHNPTYLPAIYKNIENADVVIGSRYVRGGSTQGWEVWRRLLSRGGNMYTRLITGIPIRDFTGGFNTFRTSVLRKINFDTFDSSGYAFQMELKNALHQAGARFVEYPILFTNRKEGESKISNHIISEGIMAPWKLRFKKHV